MNIDKFAIVHFMKKSLMVFVLLLALACTMIGCGIQEHNEYVSALNGLGTSINTKENEGVNIGEQFKADPSDMEVRSAYGKKIAELANLYNGYADITPIVDVAAEHQELVDAANGVAELYKSMMSVLLNDKIDLTKDEGLQQLGDSTENLEELALRFTEKLDALVSAINN